MMNYSFSEYLSKFFTKYLINQKNASSNTIRSYKLTFKLLINYIIKEKNISLRNIDFNIFTRDTIIEFLGYLENNNNISVVTRNQRLAAIKSFCNYMVSADITNISNFQKILSISKKKCESKIIDYLTKEEYKLFINSIDKNHRKGIRDYTLITLMYDSACREDEIIKIKLDDLKLDNNPTVTLLGKGNKYRIVPITISTKNLIEKYIKLENIQPYSYLFPGYQNKASTKMVYHIIKKYALKCNISKNIHPHVLRHTRAMHMVESGIALYVIRDFLGHTNIETTQIYARIDVETKRKALSKVFNDGNDDAETNPYWKNNNDVLKELFEIED